MINKILLLICFVLFSCNPDNSTTNIIPTNNSAQSVNICPTTPQWTVHFSPNGGTTNFIVEEISKAHKSIYVQAYSFTSHSIANALISAHHNGIHVEIILDKSDMTGKGSALSLLRDKGITVFVDDKHAIAHNKIIIIDNEKVFTGSFNFTNAAEHANAENSIELIDNKIAEVYRNNWNLHKEHSLIQR